MGEAEDQQELGWGYGLVLPKQVAQFSDLRLYGRIVGRGVRQVAQLIQWSFGSCFGKCLVEELAESLLFSSGPARRTAVAGRKGFWNIRRISPIAQEFCEEQLIFYVVSLFDQLGDLLL